MAFIEVTVLGDLNHRGSDTKRPSQSKRINDVLVATIDDVPDEPNQCDAHISGVGVVRVARSAADFQSLVESRS